MFSVILRLLHRLGLPFKMLRFFFCLSDLACFLFSFCIVAPGCWTLLDVNKNIVLAQFSTPNSAPKLVSCLVKGLHKEGRCHFFLSLKLAFLFYSNLHGLVWVKVSITSETPFASTILCICLTLLFWFARLSP